MVTTVVTVATQEAMLLPAMAADKVVVTLVTGTKTINMVRRRKGAVVASVKTFALPGTTLHRVVVRVLVAAVGNRKIKCNINSRTVLETHHQVILLYP